MDPAFPDPLDRRTLGDRLRTIRKDVLRMSQEELATELGADKGTIGAYERGETRVPLDVVCRIAWRLQMPIDYLVRPETAERVYVLDAELVEALRADAKLRETFSGRFALPVDASSQIVRTRADLARLEEELRR